MNKGDASNLNKLNTTDLVNHLSSDKNNEKKMDQLTLKN